MRKACKLGVLIFIGIALITVDVFATGVSLTGIGCRATAFGGAFRAISNDWSAGYWNPAGLVQIQKWQVGTSIEFISPKVNYTPALYNSQNLSVLYAKKIENEPKKFIVPSFGIGYKTGKMAFGFSFFAPFGLGSQWNMFNTAAYNASYPKIEFDDNLTLLDFHPTFAYQVTDKLAVGVGVSILSADIRIQMAKLNFSPALASVATYSQLGVAFNTTNSYLLSDAKLKGDGLGFGGNIGVLYKVTKDLHVGVSARYYNDIKLDGSFVVDTYFPNDLTAQATLSGALQAGYITQAQFGQLIVPFSGVKATTLNDTKVKATLPLPMNVGIGFAYYGIQNLTVSMDVDLTQWSAWKVIKIDMSDGSNQELTEKWEDAIRVAVALEYKLNQLKLRGAFYTENEATIDATLTPSIPDVNRRNTVIAGLGYSLGCFELNLHSELILIGNRTVKTWQLNSTGTGFDNYAGKYGASTFTVLGGFEYNF